MAQTQKHGTACRTCRRRGRRCDKTLPICKTCENNGRVCDGYVFRWAGMAARGRLAGKLNPMKTPTKSYHDKLMLEGTQTNPRSTPSQIISLLERPITSDVQTLINYYIEEITAVSYLGAKPDESPYVQFVLPLLKDVVPLRYAVAASAACHWAARIESSELERQSLHLRLEATKSLRSRLESKQSTDYGSLVSMMMLAQLDMCSRQTGEFEVHLNGAKSIIQHHKASSPGAVFFEQRLTWLDVVGCTTSSRIPTLQPADIRVTISQINTPNGREWASDVFPCSVEIFECIADITMLYKHQADRFHPLPDTVAMALNIMQRIRKWTPPMSMISAPEKWHVLEAWRLGVLLYAAHLFQIAGDDLAATALTIFSHAKAVPVASGWAYSMLFSLLQAGLALNGSKHDIHRDWLRDHIRAMLLAVGCGGFYNALETLKTAWSQYDTGYTWAEVIGKIMSGPLIMA